MCVAATNPVFLEVLQGACYGPIPVTTGQISVYYGLQFDISGKTDNYKLALYYDGACSNIIGSPDYGRLEDLIQNSKTGLFTYHKKCTAIVPNTIYTITQFNINYPISIFVLYPLVLGL